MRRALTRGVLLVALCAVAAGARAQMPDIVDLYREMQIARGEGFPTYELAEPNGAATASGGVLYGARARVTVTLDRPRFYLRIDDAGDAEGATGFVTEFVMWLDPEGFPLVGLSERAVTAGIPRAGRLRFYSRASDRWNLVTREVFPALDLSVCGTRPPDVDESTTAWAGLGQAVALLPRTGTDIEIWCVGESPVAGTGRRVEWDRLRGRFAASERLAGPPPWPDGSPTGR
ncbi:hypothetical protein [Xanthobacter sp. KR7-225]|uniref:hypothetical protein n=1 Tax=Xanthobacter sp. KR7-225 TaxID=3156613 RepID=UPI0032B3333B